jgi:hypothetical protein
LPKGDPFFFWAIRILCEFSTKNFHKLPAKRGVSSDGVTFTFLP